MSAPHVTLTHVFAAGPGGGNPAPIVLDAAGVRQGRAMGRPSEIVLRFADDAGLWLGGDVR